MLERALSAAAATNGLVDPTLGEAIESAGYDRDFEVLEPLAEPARPGDPGRWRSVRLHGTWLLRPRGLKLDLNGVVKGQTVDEALALIGDMGFGLRINTDAPPAALRARRGSPVTFLR